MYVSVAANNYPTLPANTTPPERPPFEGFYRGPTPQQALLAMHIAAAKAAANSHMSEHAHLVSAALGFDAAATATATSVVDTRHYHDQDESPPARRRPSDEDTRSTPTSQGSSRCAY